MSKQYESLYLERYANGHRRGCPQAIPEIRSAMFVPKCECLAPSPAAQSATSGRDVAIAQLEAEADNHGDDWRYDHSLSVVERERP